MRAEWFLFLSVAPGLPGSCCNLVAACFLGRCSLPHPAPSMLTHSHMGVCKINASIFGPRQPSPINKAMFITRGCKAWDKTARDTWDPVRWRTELSFSKHGSLAVCHGVEIENKAKTTTDITYATPQQSRKWAQEASCLLRVGESLGQEVWAHIHPASRDLLRACHVTNTTRSAA